MEMVKVTMRYTGALLEFEKNYLNKGYKVIHATPVNLSGTTEFIVYIVEKE